MATHEPDGPPIRPEGRGRLVYDKHQKVIRREEPMATRTVEQRASDLRGYLNRIMPLSDQREAHRLLDKLLEQIADDHREAAALVAHLKAVLDLVNPVDLRPAHTEARALLRRLE